MTTPSKKNPVGHKIYSFGRSFLGHHNYILKGWGLGINSSQLKNVGKIQLSIQLSHLSIIFEYVWF